MIFGIQLGAGLMFSVGFVGAVWVSNIPQALPPSADLRASAWSARKMSMLWGGVVVAAGLFALVGYLLATNVTGTTGARIASFTVGGLVTMISTSMIPFAYDKGGIGAGLWAAAGFAAALAGS